MIKDVITLLVLTLFVYPKTISYNSQALDQIQSIYIFDLDELTQQLLSLEKNFEKLDQRAFKNEISSIRIQYKKVETLTDYFQRDVIAKYINGAPLPKTDPTMPGIEIIKPNGLQRLDELAYSETYANDRKEIFDLIHLINLQWKDVYAFERRRKLQHRTVFEAMRTQIIRVFSLSLTGFDTPGSVQGILESQMAIETLSKYISAYNNEFNLKELHQLESKLSLFNEYLHENNDFDDLDRLFVLTEFVNPIYELIYECQHALNIEFVEETDATLKPTNYHSKNIFDANFFNKSFYAQIAESDLSNERIIGLGKTLFFDPVLSKNRKMSCATCHQPEKGFTDGLTTSRAFKQGGFTKRNSPTLVNSVYAEKYFHDMREYDLERQVKHVVYNKEEFNMDFIELSDLLKASDEYVALFKDAYGNRDKYIISSWSISNALAAYVASLSSYNSSFDLYVRNESNQITESAKQGFNLFMGKAACGTCHFAPSFSGLVPPYYSESESEVLGVTVTFDTISPLLDPDLGRIQNGRARDEVIHFAHSFKTPTIRNSKLTGPYMHNGAFSSLEEVMHFYNHGGGQGLGIDIPNQTLPPDKLNLSSMEMKNIIDFMESLTDTANMTSIPSTLPKFGVDSIDNRSIQVY